MNLGSIMWEVTRMKAVLCARVALVSIGVSAATELRFDTGGGHFILKRQ